MSKPTKYSDGQPQLAKQLSIGQPVHILGTTQQTKMADHLLERIQQRYYGNVSLVFLKQLMISENSFQVLKVVPKVQVCSIINIKVSQQWPQEIGQVFKVCQA